MDVNEALAYIEDATPHEDCEAWIAQVLAAEVRRLHVAGDALMAATRSLAYAWETDTPDRVMWDKWAKVQPAIEAWMNGRRGEQS